MSKFTSLILLFQLSFAFSQNKPTSCENIYLLEDFTNPLYEKHLKIDNVKIDTVKDENLPFPKVLPRAYDKKTNALYSGICCDFYANSKSIERELTYRDGLLRKVTEYFPNGNISEITNFLYNEAHGKYEKYDINGKMVIQGHYEEGFQIDHWIYFEKGKKKSEGGFNRMGKHGNWIYYNSEEVDYLLEQYHNGILRGKRDIINGKIK